MHASQRCCDLWGFCACKDGGQSTGELASWPRSFTVHQAEPGPDVIGLLLVLCTSCSFLPAPGTGSHFFSLPMCGPPALKTATGLPGHQAPRSTGSTHGLSFPRPIRRTSSYAPGHQGMGSPVLRTCPREPVLIVFSCEGSC